MIVEPKRLPMDSWYLPYRQLKNELHPLLDSNRRNLELCMKQWAAVKEQYLQSSIRSRQVELDFFRFVKPRFTALVEFYLLLHECQLFCPPHPAEALLYWQNELERIERFHKTNRIVLAYYHSGNRQRDEEFFSHEPPSGHLPAEEFIYFDEDCRSRKDAVIRRYHAFQLYQRFVEHRLQNLQNANSLAA